MGDRTWTSISFSGVINRDVALQLVEELHAQGCSCDDGPAGDLTLQHLTIAEFFYAEQCNYASMEGVEAVCQENGITYLKHWAAGGGYDAGYELYLAVADQSMQVAGGEEPAMGARDLRACLERGNTLQDVIDYLDKIENFREHFPPLEIRG